MYRWINEKNEVITTKTVKEFAERHGKMSQSMARSLACGYRARLRGWCSTSRKAKKYRERFTTVLVNTQTGERKILGRSITHFARENFLCENEVWRLVNGESVRYRGWCLEKSLQLANELTAGANY